MESSGFSHKTAVSLDFPAAFRSVRADALLLVHRGNGYAGGTAPTSLPSASHKPWGLGESSGR
ncbi:hypothetical protein [Hymenobacter jeollabukensis]|uniref:Uncharacterized protein n=1 Tax=Hymenobacter jeollabukensis TaxID=2025313 RepID=A0A5R8WPP4_9BACT|nr:hypothetical protein [Hymenobacter jeollabukensis]TLM92283.1 hypothetical protein FDY95_12660 [Hymenobacter jeollabukensis]